MGLEKIWALFMLSIVCRLLVAEAIWMNLASDGTKKCISEELQHDAVVVGDYIVIVGGEKGFSYPSISVKVTSPYGNEIYHQQNVTQGQFAFTANEIGSYEACFWVDDGHQSATLNVDWKIGITAKDWDSVAKKENIEGVELELRKLEGIVEAIHEKLLNLQTREWKMRQVSEKTNERVAWYSTMSLGVGIVAAIFQVWHLKRYFQKRKLI